MINQQPPRGFNDHFDQRQQIRERLIAFLNFRAQQFGFVALDVPIVENKSVYDKPIGDTTAIRTTDFFSLSSKKEGHELVLRPEFTSGVIRAILKQFGPHNRGTKNFYSSGHCFRYERPQKFRSRQFLQWNLESIWVNDEKNNLLYLFLYHLIQEIFVNSNQKLSMNFNYISWQNAQNIGAIIEKSDLFDKLCLFCQNRFNKKAFYQILDCSDCDKIIQKVKDEINESFEEHNSINSINIFDIFSFASNKTNYQKTLGRGLSYYSGPVFEFGFSSEISNNRWISLIGGGSYLLNCFYDDFRDQKGAGFAIGIDRVCEIQDLSHLSALNLTLQKIKILFVLEKSFSVILNEMQGNPSKIKAFLAIQKYFVQANYQICMDLSGSNPKQISKKKTNQKCDYLLYFDDQFWTNSNAKIHFQNCQKSNDSSELLIFSEIKKWFTNNNSV